MNIYQAMMLAADQIERSPDLYDFQKVTVPECGTPGCMIGWTGAFLGLKAGTLLEYMCTPQDGVCAKIGLSDQQIFYDRLRSLGETDFHKDAKAAAKALRHYAAHYHSSERDDDRSAFDAFLKRVLTPQIEPCAARSTSNG